jgi:hypothetical protein
MPAGKREESGSIMTETPAAQDDTIAAFCTRVDRAIADNRPEDVSDEALSRVLVAALRAFAFKTEKAGEYVEPYGRGALTATETVTAVTALVRAADLNLWDVAMWFNRAGSAPARSEGERQA